MTDMADRVMRVLSAEEDEDANSVAERICLSAARLVGSKRKEDHGDARESFEAIAREWQLHLEHRPDPTAPLTAADVAWMMVKMKMVRAQFGRFNPDNFEDACGYAGLAAALTDRKE